jgi:hypothetical protein
LANGGEQLVHARTETAVFFFPHYSLRLHSLHHRCDLAAVFGDKTSINRLSDEELSILLPKLLVTPCREFQRPLNPIHAPVVFSTDLRHTNGPAPILTMQLLLNSKFPLRLPAPIQNRPGAPV